MPLVLYLKSHHQTQGHLGFLLRYLLEVLREFFFFFLDHTACGILVHQPGIKPHAHCSGSMES